MGKKKVTYEKSGDFDEFRWASMPGKEQENDISAMTDQYCLQQIYQGQLPKGIHVEPGEGYKRLAENP